MTKEKWYGLLSNFCGPGGTGVPVHAVDRICQDHDRNYQRIMDSGKNPYTHFNWADQQMMDELRELPNKGLDARQIFLKEVASRLWTMKREFTSHLAGEDTNQPGSRKRPLDGTDPSSITTSSTSSKRHRGETEQQSSNMGATKPTTSAAHGHKGMSKGDAVKSYSVKGGEHHSTSNAKQGEVEGEQQVTALGHVWRRFPNTATAALKWVTTYWCNNSAELARQPFDIQSQKTATDLTTTDGGAISTPATSSMYNAAQGINLTTPYLMQYRMTSPYSIVKAINGLSTTALEQPCWMAYFDTKYQYYHTLECEWEITINIGEFNTGASGHGENYAPVFIFWKYTSEDEPPTTVAFNNPMAHSAFNKTTGEITPSYMANTPATTPCTPDDYFRMGGWHHKHVSLSTVHTNRVCIEGVYKFGQCKMDIKTLTGDAAGLAAPTAEGWTNVRSVPVFPENLSVIIVADNGYNLPASSASWNMSLRHEFEYLIQFKDLNAYFKYPTAANNNVSSALTKWTTDKVFFTEGAGNM